MPHYQYIASLMFGGPINSACMRNVHLICIENNENAKVTFKIVECNYATSKYDVTLTVIFVRYGPTQFWQKSFQVNLKPKIAKLLQLTT